MLPLANENDCENYMRNKNLEFHISMIKKSTDDLWQRKQSLDGLINKFKGELTLYFSIPEASDLITPSNFHGDFAATLAFVR